MSTWKTRLVLFWVGVAALTVLLLGASTASAQLPVPPSSQFDVVGFIQSATLDPAGATGDVLAGGTITVNGRQIIVPRNTIVEMPAAALTWQQLFSLAPAPWGLNTVPPTTGMAATDVSSGGNSPLATYEARVIGNRVLGPPDRHIAGLIYISQQSLNAGSGYINYIDYAKGELRVGGTIGDPNTGTRVQINDPVIGGTGAGRYSKGLSPDVRFTADQDNPTIRTDTGYPMGLPVTDPATADDPLRPQGQRPKNAAGNYVTIFTMPDPNTLQPGQLPDSRLQLPFEVGDFVSFMGTLVKDGLEPTAGPNPGPAGTYISAHTITANLGWYTWPGTDPAYVAIDVLLLGVGGTTAIGLTEATARTRFEGFCTDPSRNIHLFGLDVDPITGATTERDWGSIDVDQGPPTGAVKGRWRFRPPGRVLSMPAGGTFLPATRNMRAALTVGIPPSDVVAARPVAANGIVAGQYTAPIFEYIFPENIVGNPIPPNNFETIPFLAQGQGPLPGTPPQPVVGQLSPWPGDVVPPQAGPQPPVATATASTATVASGGTVTLSGGASGTAPFTFAWSQTAGPAGTFTPNPPNQAQVTFTAPAVAANTPVTLRVTVSNAVGTSTADVTVTVNAAAAPTAVAGAAQVVSSGTQVTLHGSGTDPAGLPLTYTWTQGGPTAAAWPVTLNPSAKVAQPKFTLTLPLGQTQVVLWFQLVVTNSAGVSSAADLTTVTVNPIPDAVTITAAQYRIGKQRLTINASSSVISPNVVLTLQPYVTTTGATYTPATPMTLINQGGGLYLIDLVGVPEPAIPPTRPLVVKSNLGGSSPPTALTNIRN